MNKFSILLLVLTILSSLIVVAVRHENRLKFVRLQSIESERDRLQVEWGRLMLEKGTWSIEHSIADDAGNRLGMRPPPPQKIITVRLKDVN